MIFHVRFMLFEFQPIKHNTAFDYKTKTIHYLIIIEMTVSLATCRNIMYEIEGFLHMPASHRLGFSLRNLEKVELKENPCSPRALREKDEQKRFINSGDMSLFVFSLRMHTLQFYSGIQTQE